MATNTFRRQGRQHPGGDRPRAGRSSVGTGPVRVLMAATLLCAAQTSSDHVDSRTGDDTPDGLGTDRPWQTLDRVNAVFFGPGGRVRFAAGSAGTVKESLKPNGVHYPVAEGARHERVYGRLSVEPRALRRGLNRIGLRSDTEPHGIEVIHPSPARAVRDRTQPE